MLEQITPVIILFVFVSIFGSVLLTAAALLGKKTKKNLVKQMSYECGVVGQDSGTTQIPIKFYLTAISFILFDIEVVFLYPWALIYMDQIKLNGGILLISMGLFFAILTYGLIYEWKVKALEWD
jgi:NADH-quinone oxidoreductase subunit A